MVKNKTKNTPDVAKPHITSDHPTPLMTLLQVVYNTMAAIYLVSDTNKSEQKTSQKIYRM